VSYRTGTILVATNGAGPDLNYNDSNVQNASTGITLSVSQTGTNCYLDYTSSNTGVSGTIYYSVTYLA
jgi:hypothetical protein